MLRFLLRRIGLAVPTLFGLLVLTFIMVRLVPANPAAELAGQNATPAQIAEIRHRFGFDRPLYQQFGIYLGQIARLHFGNSAFSDRPVATDIGQRLPATLELVIASMVLTVGFGVPLGVIAAANHDRWPDFLLRTLSVGGIAMATFWLAIILQLIFSMQLGWLPLRGEIGVGAAAPTGPSGFLLLDSLLAGRTAVFWDAVRHLILPAVTLSLGGMATITRFTRAGVLDTLQKDFVLYERAVGYPRWRMIWIYVLRNSVVATVTQIGLLFGALIAGDVVVEAIFDWPGIGNYIVNAILAADYKVILAVTLVIGVIYAAVNIITDLVQGVIDPRIRNDR